jgi:hypothetical protein
MLKTAATLNGKVRLDVPLDPVQYTLAFSGTTTSR